MIEIAVVVVSCAVKGVIVMNEDVGLAMEQDSESDDAHYRGCDWLACRSILKSWQRHIAYSSFSI